MPDESLSGARSGGVRIVVRPTTFAATAATFLARVIASWNRDAPMRVGLSGGSTPGPVYRRLAGSPLPDWTCLELFLADERAVRPDHAQSNLRLVHETLAGPAGISTGRVHAMIRDEDVGADGTISDQALLTAAARYEAEFPERLDLLVLGLGDDGHTASLFPGQPAVAETERKVLVAEAPAEPRRRLTITPPVIAAARMCVVLVHGAGKAAAVRAAQQRGPADEVPGRLARQATWIIGSDAVRDADTEFAAVG